VGAIIREPVPGWVPTRTRAEKEQRQREGELDRNHLDGPPLFLCHGCGKIEEGSWSGKHSYPKKNRHIYVAQAISMTPVGWTGVIVERGSGMCAICSPECFAKYHPEGATSA